MRRKVFNGSACEHPVAFWLGASYGFGVVFSPLSVAGLAALAPDVMACLLADAVRWDGVEVRTGGWSTPNARSRPSSSIPNRS